MFEKKNEIGVGVKHQPEFTPNNKQKTLTHPSFLRSEIGLN